MTRLGLTLGLVLALAGIAPAAAAAQNPGATLRPGEGAWANYDFVPGDRTLFVEDFTGDNVGDFPRRLELVSGNMEVVESQGNRYLRVKGGGKVLIPLPEVLPEQFTVEFDYTAGADKNSLRFAKGSGLSYVYFGGPESVYCGSSGVGGPVESSGCAEHVVKDQLLHARIMADGHYVKVYVNETRVANVPNANLGRANWIEMSFQYHTFLLGHITVAAGGRKLYDALAAHGRVATHGILFDSGSDQLRPESTPTLKQIGNMLAQHPDLKLTIEGHTDNVGGDAANQTLSEKRAAAVKQYLVSTYSIDPARLTTKGFGASQPVSPNSTPEGRQNNRRVELVKM
jgi:OOP family OmpA-OmpF porin